METRSRRPSLIRASRSDISLDEEEPYVPFAEQFDYRLKDCPVISFESNFRPIGFVTIRLPDVTSLQLEFDPFETIAELRVRLQTRLNFDIASYHLVTRRGILPLGTSMRQLHIREGSHLLLVGETAERQKSRQTRDFWVQERANRTRDPRLEHVDKSEKDLNALRRQLKSRRGKLPGSSFKPTHTAFKLS
jgi:hypothetical protein